MLLIKALRVISHIQAYSEPFLTLAHSEHWYIFRTLEHSGPEAYAELWYFQNPGIFRTLSNIYDRVFVKIFKGYSFAN